MKKISALLLALLLLLTGCGGKTKEMNISVKDASCPYKIDHKKDMVEVTLRAGENSGILWRVEAIPEDICEVTQEGSGNENTSRYQLTAVEPGAAQLVFSAVTEDETIIFELTLGAQVTADGKVVVSSSRHRQREAASVAANGLEYRWDVEIDGTLNFTFTNLEDNWYIQSIESDVCSLTNELSTPNGCMFSARVEKEGKTTVTLVGENTQRKIDVMIRVDANNNAEVLSVQER